MMQLDAKQPEAVAEARDSILRSGGLLAASLGSAHGVMGKGQNHVTLTSKSIIYGTPLWLFKELDAEFHFTTDVCSIPELALCDHYYTPEVDGLAQEWRGACWMNPPYGKEIGKWIRKAYESSLAGATVVSLLPARVDTKWFHDWVWNKAEIRYPRGRLTFRGAVSVSTRKRWQAPFACLIAIHRPPSASAPNVPALPTASEKS